MSPGKLLKGQPPAPDCHACASNVNSVCPPRRSLRIRKLDATSDTTAETPPKKSALSKSWPKSSQPQIDTNTNTAAAAAECVQSNSQDTEATESTSPPAESFTKDGELVQTCVPKNRKQHQTAAMEAPGQR